MTDDSSPQAEAAPPIDSRTRSLLASARQLAADRKFKLAAKLFHDALAGRPDLVDERIEFCMVLVNMRNIPKAREQAAGLEEVTPRDEAQWRALVDLFERMRRQPSIALVTERFINEVGENPWAELRMAELRKGGGEYARDEGRAWLWRALAHAVPAAEFWMKVGEVQAWLVGRDAAAEALFKAVELDPSHFPARRLLVQNLIEIAKDGTAREQLALLAENAKTPRDCAEAAALAIRLDQHDTARPLAERAAEDLADVPAAAKLSLARTWLALNEPDRARETLVGMFAEESHVDVKILSGALELAFDHHLDDIARQAGYRLLEIAPYDDAVRSRMQWLADRPPSGAEADAAPEPVAGEPKRSWLGRLFGR